MNNLKKGWRNSKFIHAKALDHALERLFSALFLQCCIERMLQLPESLHRYYFTHGIEKWFEINGLAHGMPGVGLCSLVPGQTHPKEYRL